MLTGVGVSAACVEIAHTLDQKEKNEVFVETIASTVTSGAITYPVGLFLASNQVGWGVVLVLAMGTAAVSWRAGVFARTVYSKKFESLDLVTGLGVGKVCG